MLVQVPWCFFAGAGPKPKLLLRGVGDLNLSHNHMAVSGMSRSHHPYVLIEVKPMAGSTSRKGFASGAHNKHFNPFNAPSPSFRTCEALGRIAQVCCTVQMSAETTIPSLYDPSHNLESLCTSTYHRTAPNRMRIRAHSKGPTGKPQQQPQTYLSPTLNLPHNNSKRTSQQQQYTYR